MTKVKDIGSRPDWIREPPTFDFQEVNRPLRQVCDNMLAVLDRLGRRAPEPHAFTLLLKHLLAANLATHKATIALLVHKPPFPAQVAMLTRSIFDSIFTVCALAHDPERYARRYQRAGYREVWEELRGNAARYGKAPGSADYLAEGRRFLASYGAELGLSADEMADPKRLPKWPTPGKMLNQISFSDHDRVFLTDLLDGRYGVLSASSHVHWTGLAAAVVAASGGAQWLPGKDVSDAALASLLFLLMLASEVERINRYGYNDDLNKIWTTLLTHAPEVQRYYEMRYKKQLGA